MSRLRALAWALGLPLLGFAWLLGVGQGLLRDLPAVLALIGGGVMVFLPAAGVSSLTGRGLWGALGAAWVWPVLLVLSWPAYFPQERADALSAGYALIVGEAPSGLSLEVVQALTELPRAARVLTPRPGATPAPAQPAPSEAAPAEPAAVVSSAPPRAPDSHLVHFEDIGRSLRIPVRFEARGEAVKVPMIFDTGASMTTLEPKTVAALGVRVSGDAPRVTLRTAGGTREVPLALIDRVVIAGAVVEGVTVAVCEACAPEPTQGLLGLNVSGQFYTTVDHDAQAIVLTERGEQLDRITDVSPWIKLDSVARSNLMGTVSLEITARNRSTRHVQSLDVEVACGPDVFSVQIDDVPSGGTATAAAELPRGTACSRYTIGLLAARW